MQLEVKFRSGGTARIHNDAGWTLDPVGQRVYNPDSHSLLDQYSTL